MVNHFGKATAAFVAMLDKWHGQNSLIPQILIASQYTKKGQAPYQKIDLQLHSLFL